MVLFRLSNRGAVCLAFAAVVSGCATPPLPKFASLKSATAQAAPGPETKRTVQSIHLESTSVDGQTTWVIEPDVPRIPKVGGLDANLPPHIERQLSRAFDLAQRGATYSANTEFQSVLGLCALDLDVRDGGTAHREALRQGILALDEADEFANSSINWQNSEDVRRTIACHSTPVLHGDSSIPVDSIQAVQTYYKYAEERFTYACDGAPGASLALYGMARTFVMPETRFTHAAGKAAMLQRVALRISPENVLAGNELGVLLAQHGHLEEAEGLFRKCVATNATPETWRNLGVIYARQGDKEASQAAFAAGEALVAQRKSGKPQLTPVVEIETAVASNEKQRPKEPSNEVKGTSGYWERLDLASKLPIPFRR